MFNSSVITEAADSELKEMKQPNNGLYPSLLGGVTGGYADFLPNGWEWFVADAGLTSYFNDKSLSEASIGQVKS